MSMRKNAALAVVCLSSFLNAAHADGVVISGAQTAMPVDNDFSHALPDTLLAGARLALQEPARLVFTPVAAESGNHNSLVVVGLGVLSEDRDFGFRRGGRGQIAGIFQPGTLDQLFFTSDFGAGARPGGRSFGVFVDGNAGESFTTFYLGYDDTPGDDDDFDDYIIRVDVEPLN